ncbi:MAG: UDP-3-O-acyl-N-acetylglucosamine deacetylase [Fimbriimonadales bacterium]
MIIDEQRATVRETICFEGIGLHTGEHCRVAVHPVSAGNTPCALTIRKGASVFPARWDYVVDTARATVLGNGATRVSTVEHLMAALWMTGITHAEIEVLHGDEIPILDGSALPFVEALGASIAALPPLPVSERLRHGRSGISFQLGQSHRFLGLACGGDTLFGYIDFPAPLGVQAGAFPLPAAAEQIAPARTFGFLHEVAALRQQGLAQGGTLENALVIDETGYHNPARFEDEPLRHKLLDVLGDLYLCGVRLSGFTLVAIKPGHTINAQLARQVAQALLAED